jgi:hypothetical protein
LLDPHLVPISAVRVQRLLRDVAEKTRDIVQKKLAMPEVRLVWYQHRWLLPGKGYTREQFESWQEPFLDDRDRMIASIMNMHLAEGERYCGRTMPGVLPDTVFIAAASLPPLSDEGQMRDLTQYRVGVTVVHEMRHLWQGAKGWDMGDMRTCERDAEAFTKSWRGKVKEVVRRSKAAEVRRRLKPKRAGRVPREK